jgi:2-polyprenyl-3-methyl-5-hydroxy-6-metoxy-1,4-benzoquinol methylase
MANNSELKYTFKFFDHCNMCNADKSKQNVMGRRLNTSQGYRPKNKIGISTTIMQCQSCKLIYSNPLPIPNDIQDHYGVLPESYWVESYFTVDPEHLKGLIVKLKSQLDFNSKLKSLDIGAGIGKGMIALKSAGFDAFGIEPSEQFYDRAIHKMGVSEDKLQCVMIENANFDENQFDIILLMDVIEHLYHPNELMQICNKILKKDGLLVILTGDINAINAKLWQEKWYYFYSWEHISFFSKKSLIYLTERNGFSLLSIRSVSHINGFLYNLYTIIIHNPLMYIYNFYIKKRYKHINLAFDHILLIVKK